jgi:hypothetical protein
MGHRAETIVCLSTCAWHSLWRNIHQVMSRLAPRYRVLFVEPQRNPELPYAAHFRHALRHFRALRVEPVQPNLVVVPTPGALPYGRGALPGAMLQRWVPLVAEANVRLLRWHVRRVCQRLEVQRPILWLHEPRQAGLIGTLGERLAVYYNYDELADFAPNHRIRGLLQAYDEALCRRVDLIFATSSSQYARRRPLNAHTHLVPNAVDFDLFSQAVDPLTPEAPALAGLPRPILGLVGWLGYQVDVDLLLRVAQAYPSYSVVLVGPDALARTPQYQALRQQPNVVFTGQQPPAALPGFLKAMDVALLPYTLSGHTHAIYPLKLHEYLAAGRSVVTTDLPELRTFGAVLHIAADAEAFVGLIPRALADYSPERRGQRLAIARQHTWEQRVSAIAQALEQRLADKD